MPTIIFTGGGTAGHVTPNIALIDVLRNHGWEIHYIGSHHGIEKKLIQDKGIAYHAVRSEKLRRQASLKTLLIPFKLLIGIIQSFFLCQKIKPDVVFSKGGFVAVPVVIGAWLNRRPIVAHESDLTPGLANRLSFPFCQTICVTFPEGKKYFKDADKVVVTGTPVRPELLSGDKARGLALCQFTDEKPVLLIMGGSQGAQHINHVVQQALPSLLEHYQVAHICGKGKVNATTHMPGYKQFEYVTTELGDLYAASDIVISRAGANSIYELLMLKKAHILIPLSLKASRGDQIANANYFLKKGMSAVIQDDLLTPELLIEWVNDVFSRKNEIQTTLEKLELPDGVKNIPQLLINTIATSE